MEIDPALVERMVKLTKKLASTVGAVHGLTSYFVSHKTIDEARAIAAELPAPDPDKVIVDAVIADEFPDAAEPNEWAMRRVAMACLKRARQESTR